MGIFKTQFKSQSTSVMKKKYPEFDEKAWASTVSYDDTGNSGNSIWGRSVSAPDWIY